MVFLPKFILKKRQFNILTVVASALIAGLFGFLVGTRATGIAAYVFSVSANRGLPNSLDFSSLSEVYNVLRSKYDGKLSASALLDGAKKGLVAAAGDQYTVYFNSNEAQQFTSDLEGTFSGIGAELDKKDNQLLVTSTLDGSPAQAIGLQAQDRIAKVNGQDTSSWSIDQAVSTIRGPKGTTVKLTIVRGQDVKEFSIVRADIVAPSVIWQETSDNIGYIRISRFASDTTDLATKAAQEFKSKGVKGVVLDLRGNGGGYVTAAQDIASLWLNNKVVVQERRDSQVEQTLRSGTNPILAGLPTVVLVDGGSASASEIVSGALHDNGVAKLVGVKTFGKGSVQELLSLANGSELKVTVDKWYTPSGKNISSQGIQPDVVVQMSDDDVKNGRDPQKDKAIEIVNHL